MQENPFNFQDFHSHARNVQSSLATSAVSMPSSERRDSNPRSPDPKSGGLTKLSYIPKESSLFGFQFFMQGKAPEPFLGVPGLSFILTLFFTPSTCPHPFHDVGCGSSEPSFGLMPVLLFVILRKAHDGVILIPRSILPITTRKKHGWHDMTAREHTLDGDDCVHNVHHSHCTVLSCPFTVFPPLLFPLFVSQSCFPI